MVKIMICGTRDEGDVDLLVEEGADAIGFITEVRQDISCNLTREEACRLISRVPSPVVPVLIVTGEKVEEICRLVEYARPAAVQLHGFNSPDETAILKRRLPVDIIKTLHVRKGGATDEGELARMGIEYLAAGADYILLDSATGEKVGSTGLTLDFRAARRLRDVLFPGRLILAGGLNARNIGAALQIVQPHAVDVYSGVVRDGRLNPGLVKDFISMARCADKEEINVAG